MSRAKLNHTFTIPRQRPAQDSELSEASESDIALPKLSRHRTKDLLSSRRNTIATISVKKSSDIQLKILRRWSEDQRRAIAATPITAKGTAVVLSTTPSQTSTDEARKIKAFVIDQLKRLGSAPSIQKLIENFNEPDSLLDQCLGLSPLTMSINDWAILDWTRHELNQLAFIDDDPEFFKFTQAIENCPARITRARDDMLRTITIALDKCLHNDKNPMQLGGHLTKADTTSMTHQKLETFMRSVRILLNQESGELTAAEMRITALFLKKILRHVPHTRIGSFESFVHIANRHSKDKIRKD